MAKHNADIYQTQKREHLERQKSENQESWLVKEPEVIQEYLRNFGELEKSSILENQPLPTNNLEVDKYLPNVNVSERPRTMEADCITNPNKHVVNIKTHIIKEADKQTNIEQPIETNMIPQRNPDEDQEQLKELRKEKCHFKDKDSDDEPMDTEQIQTASIVHKDVEGSIPEVNTQMPTQIEDEKITKLGEDLHLDRDTVENITSILMRDKQILEKRDAERKEYFNKKKRQKSEEQNKQKKAEKTLHARKKGKLHHNRHPSCGRKRDTK
ncbi:hypothetical protein JTB14_009543 [Gonioctena quinquepunctata]|nr:hypothetical protein JTB14_009543 [Gonioctena quinquepunctata]